MDLRGIYYVCFTLAIFFLVHTNALPRDSSVVESDVVSKNTAIITEMKVIPTETSSQFGIPGRVTCPYEEATEDPGCQEHCLPKGYTYGICVRRTCSCI